MNDTAFTPEAVMELDPGLAAPLTETHLPVIKWPNLKIGTTAVGTYSVPNNEIVHRAVARAMVRSEQIVWCEPTSIDGYEGYHFKLQDGTIRTILFYSITAVKGAPYMLEYKQGKIVWATEKTTRYYNGKPVVSDSTRLMTVPAQWADGKVHTIFTVLTQFPVNDHIGLSAMRLSRSMHMRNAWRFANDQAKVGIKLGDENWINPICHPTVDFFTAALANGAVLGIKTSDRETVVTTIQTFMDDERRIVAGLPYQQL